VLNYILLHYLIIRKLQHCPSKKPTSYKET